MDEATSIRCVELETELADWLRWVLEEAAHQEPDGSYDSCARGDIVEAMERLESLGHGEILPGGYGRRRWFRFSVKPVE